MRGLGLAGCAALALIVSARGAQAATTLEAIAAACHPVKEPAVNGFKPAGAIAASDLKDALDNEYAIAWDWSVGDAPRTNGGLIQAIALVGRNPGSAPRTKNLKSFRGIGLSVAQWMGVGGALPGGGLQTADYDQGGLKIVRKDGRAATPADLEAVLAAIYLGTPSEFGFYCKTPSPTLPEPTPGVTPPGKPTLTIAKSADDLGKGGLDDQKAGEIGFTDDKASHKATYATDITAGVAIPIFRGGKTDAYHPVRLANANLIPFVAYTRQGGKDTADDSYVNNLSLGLAANGYLVLRSDPAKPGSRTFTTFYSLNLRHETDDKLKSDAFFTQLSLQPSLPLPGNTAPVYGSSDVPFQVGFVWTVKGVADYSYVDDPWQKKALQKTSKYARLGLDLDGGLILRPDFGLGEWKTKLSGGYQFREDLRRGSGGDAHLWTAKISVEPTKGYSFGIGYEDGKELESLAKDRKVKFTVELKQ